jgi:hypothetical protein
LPRSEPQSISARFGQCLPRHQSAAGGIRPATVQVELFLDENGVKDRKGLTSTVQLRKYAGSWIISDIVYAYKHPTFDATRLRALLYEEMGRDDPNIGWRSSQALECQQRPGPAWAWQ